MIIVDKIKQKEAEAKLAVWQGIDARRNNRSIDDNPYSTESLKSPESHEGLLWCRWALGWFRENEVNK